MEKLMLENGAVYLLKQIGEVGEEEEERYIKTYYDSEIRHILTLSRMPSNTMFVSILSEKFVEDIYLPYEHNGNITIRLEGQPNTIAIIDGVGEFEFESPWNYGVGRLGQDSFELIATNLPPKPTTDERVEQLENENTLLQSRLILLQSAMDDLILGGDI